MTTNLSHYLATTENHKQPAEHYFSLGATLYMPATRGDLAAIANGQKLPSLRSLVICTEDAVLQHDLSRAMDNLRRTLATLAPRQLRRFVRPRDPETLRLILDMPGVERLDGVVLPKTTPHNLALYAEYAARWPGLWLMPTLETDMVFDRRALESFRDRLAQVINPILCLRVGGNDLLNLLALRRSSAFTFYDTPLRGVIEDIILIFRPAGYEIAAPVFDILDCPATLAREVALDIHHGLLTKTAIHPVQIPIIENAYRVSPEDEALARRILDPGAQAVFRHGGQMCEPTTQRNWAERLMARAARFGLNQGRNP